jgi:uncharacterized protein (TIGR02001 family)
MFKNKLLNTLILAALSVPGLVQAADAPAPTPAVTYNVSLTSNYIWRGVSQTAAKPAIQGGLDYAHASGFYAGAWASNITWIKDEGAASSAPIELDTYAGFKNAFATDYSYDVGFIRYNYPGTYISNPSGYVKADTNEVYGLIGYKWITAKYSYSLGDFITVPDAKGTSYLDISAAYTLADSGVTLGGHYGKQSYSGSSAAYVIANGPNGSYADYKLSISKDFSGNVVGLAYTSTDAKTGPGQFYYNPQGKDIAKAALALSVTRAF